MRRLFTGFMFVFLTFILFACDSGDPVSFSDDQLEDAIRAEIDKPNDDIYKDDLEDIDEMDLSDSDIENIDGLEAAENIETLSLADNDISDFSPLDELEKLDDVTVTGNPFTDDNEQIALLEDLSDDGMNVKMSKGEPDGPGGFLWKVENDDTTVYLQGTIHVASDDLFPLNVESEDAYTKADVVVPEVDLNGTDMEESQELTQELGMYDDGTDIEDHITSDLYEELEDKLNELGLPMQTAKYLKPWLLANTIDQMMTEEIGYTDGVDEYFLDRADEDEKEVDALETAKGQLSIFADRSPEFQEEQLEESLMDIDTYEEQMDELLDLYKDGDKDELLDYLLAEDEVDTEENEEMTDEAEEFMEELNDKRNEGMAEQIADYLDEGSDKTYFVIVGSLHLIQDPHVRSFLEDEGYDIEQVQ